MTSKRAKHHTLTAEEQQVLELMKEPLNRIQETTVPYPLLSAAYRWQGILVKAVRHWKPVNP